jgi:acetyltransferase
VAALAFKLAVESIKSMRKADYDIDVGRPYFDYFCEFLIFMALSADRIAYMRLDAEKRLEFTGALAKRLAEIMEENNHMLFGEAEPGFCRRHFIDLFNRRSNEYAEFDYGPEGPDFGFKRFFAACLREGLPEAASVYNPVDVLGDAGAERYRLALKHVLPDPGNDAVLVILTPQAMTEIRETAVAIAEEAGKAEKTVFAVFMGGEEVGEAERILREAGIPNFRFPEEAVRTLRGMKVYTDFLARPRLTRVRFEVDAGRVREVFDNVRSQGRKELVEVEAREVLSAYGLPVARTVLATNLEECIRAARGIGYPVVVKIASPLILHKTDIGGVVVGIGNTDDLVSAYEAVTANARKFVPAASIWGVLVQEMLPPSRELIVGMSRDSQFGPLLMAGLGGVYVEVLKDVSFRIAPLSEEEAKDMLRELKSYWLLQGARGERPADIDAVVECILRVSQLVTDFAEITELDINPLRVMEDGKGCLAADARIVLEE